jgi:hypothetical protein
MARNGSGTYSLVSGNPVVTGTSVSSTWANNTLSDIATALTASIAADGQTPVTANLPMNNHKIIGLAAGTVSGDALTYGQSLGPVAGAAYTPTSSQAFTATPTFNAALSNVFEFSGAMTANVTAVTITNPGTGQTISIRVQQDGTGGRTFATPSGAKIAGTVGATAGAASILTLTYSAMGVRWEGAWTNLPV